MATFKPGQRVRIVWSKCCPHIVGLEATILSDLYESSSADGFGQYMAHDVSIDGYGRFDTDGIRFGLTPAQLEPIQYDGNKTVEWSECLWMPEHIRVSA